MSVNARDLLPEVEAWLKDAPAGLLIEQIGLLRRTAAEYRARADQLERTLLHLEKLRVLQTWPCKAEGCENRAYVNRGPYARLCGPHRLEDELRRAANGTLPGKPSHRKKP